VRERVYYVYILASRIGGTLYIGVTSDLVRRVYEHRQKLRKGFTERYGIARLVYFERFGEIGDAIHREKRLKNGIGPGRFGSLKTPIQTGTTSIHQLLPHEVTGSPGSSSLCSGWRSQTRVPGDDKEGNRRQIFLVMPA
jgi:putative endonuclease